MDTTLITGSRASLSTLKTHSLTCNLTILKSQVQRVMTNMVTLNNALKKIMPSP